MAPARRFTIACWTATNADEQAASMDRAGPPRSQVWATMAAAMLRRLPGMENARIGTTCSISESRRLSPSAPGSARPKAPSKSCVARTRESRISLCSLTLAPTNTPARVRSHARLSYPAPGSDPVMHRGELPQLPVLEEGPLVDVGLVGNPGGRVVEPGVVPPRRRDGPEGDRAAADQLPKPQWVPGLGEPTPQPDDRDLQTASRPACRAPSYGALMLYV